MPSRPRSPGPLLINGALPGDLAHASRPTTPPQRVPLVLPRRLSGRACPPSTVAWLVVLLLASLASGLCLSLCVRCFATGGHSSVCYFRMLPSDHELATDSKKLLRLLNSILLAVSLVIFLRSVGGLWGRLISWRRDERFRARLIRDWDGGGGRSEATRKLMRGLRSVMELIHDPSLTVELSFEKLSYKLRDGTAVLTDATGVIRADEITILMGPSGCGKSTLLSLLSGKVHIPLPSLGLHPPRCSLHAACRLGSSSRSGGHPRTAASLPDSRPPPPAACMQVLPSGGRISINGKEGSVREMHRLIGFVPQDDVMLTSLSVMEILHFSAATRLPYDTPSGQRNAWVHMIIELLSLTEHRHSLIGDASRRGLSGGQRKRVNIGMELVADPSLIFLDEPTSGPHHGMEPLDPMSPARAPSTSGGSGADRADRAHACRLPLSSSARVAVGCGRTRLDGGARADELPPPPL